MVSVNKAIIIGRLGKDPEVRSSQAGKAFCNMTVATDSGFGDKKITDWHTVVAFDKQAENCGRFLKKGSMVYVEGRISYDKYEKDGQTRYTTRIIASTVQFMDSKNSQGGFSQGYDPSFDQTQSSGYGAPSSSYNQAPAYGSQQSQYNKPQYNQPQQPAPDFGAGEFTADDVPF